MRKMLIQKDDLIMRVSDVLSKLPDGEPVEIDYDVKEGRLVLYIPIEVLRPLDPI